jgi:cobalt/nickel transport protein
MSKLGVGMSRRFGWVLAGGLLVAVLLAGVASNFASSSPDGLDATARKGCTVDADGNITGGTCMAQHERAHQLKDGPLAGYGIRGIANPYLSTGLSGVLGVLVTFGVGAGVFWLVRRRNATSRNTTSGNMTSTSAGDD